MIILLLVALASAKLTCKKLKGIHRDVDYQFAKGENIVYFNLCGSVNNKPTGLNDVSAYVEAGDYYNIGTTSSETLSLSEDKQTVIFSYKGDNSAGLSSRVEVTCGTDTSSAITASNENNSVFVFRFKSPYVCDAGKDTFPIVGLILCLVLLAIVILYVVIGMLLNIFLFHKRGIEILPNFTFWVNLPGLLVDGAKFTFCCKRPGSEYQTFNV